MAFQGIEINPRDLDIVVTLNNLRKVKDIFYEYTITDVHKLSSITGEPAWEVKMKIGDVKVQVLGEKNTGYYVNKLINKRTTKVKLDGKIVSCLTLEAETDAYTETNRPQKAEMIKEFLQAGQ